ncbi:MAG TPA: ATP-binding protein [Nocardioidaceae bacterium]|nr:ATP-binding protein [Nocardioidaceae bacterium]
MSDRAPGINAQLGRLVAGMIVAVVAVGAAGAVGALRTDSTVRDLTESVGPAANANRAVLQDLTDAETALRGWILTGDDADLAPYRAAMRRLPDHQARVRAFASDQPGFAAAAADQRRAVRAWLTEYARPRLQLPAGEGSFRPAMYSRGKQAFDRLRATNATLADRFDDRVAEARAESHDALALTLVLVVLMTLLGAAAALVVGRYLAHQVSGPLIRMQQMVDRLSGGDTHARAPVSGPREVRRVAVALNEFAEENEQVRLLEQQAVERLEALDRAKSEFVANISHELRTPLTSIAGYVELLGDDPGEGLDARRRGMLRAVGRNVERLQLLVEDLLSLSSIEAGSYRGRFAAVDLAAVAAAVTEEQAGAARARDVELRGGVVESAAAPARGDVAQLHQAVTHLVRNGIKFSPAAGEVQVRAGSDSAAVWVEVCDRGPGVPPAELASLTGGFYRGSNAVAAEATGTGVGLRIVSAVADHHGGRLEIESTPGEGTTARLVLPRADPGAGEQSVPARG